MIKKIYNILHLLVLLISLLSIALFFAIFEKETVVFLAQNYLKEYEIEYEQAEGTLFEGVALKEVDYKDSTLHADELSIKYNLLMLANPTPRLKSIDAKGVHVDAQKVTELFEETSSSEFALNISKINLSGVDIKFKDEIYSLDIIASNLSIRDTVDIQDLKMQIQTQYFDISFEGRVKANRAIGKVYILLSEKVRSKYLDFLVYTPRELEVDIDLSNKDAKLKTSLKSVVFKDVEGVTLRDIDLDMIYNFDEDFFTLLSNYTLAYEGSEVLVKQKSLVSLDGKIESKLEAKLSKNSLGLPFENFILDMRSDGNIAKFDFRAKDINLSAQTSDYQNFLLKANSTYANLDAEVKIDENSSALKGKLYLKRDAPYLREYNIEKFSELELSILKNRDGIKAGLGSGLFSLTLTEDKNGMFGTLKVGSSKFDIKGDLQKRHFTIDSNIESLKSLLSEFGLNKSEEKIVFDAGANIKAELNYKERLELGARIDIPWYRLELDSKSVYVGKDAFFELFYADRELELKRYEFDIKEHRVYSQRSSKIFIDKNSDIELREFWVFDNLLVKGVIKPSQMSADINIKSDKFSYNSSDANLTLKIDLHAVMESNGIKRVDGDITLLESIVTYAPKKEYSIGDEDIIIIQDMKDDYKEIKNTELNIRITSLAPIMYKIKDVELLVTPNLAIYKELNASMELLGVVSIHSGSVTISEREFEFDESEICFYDNKYKNPHLNLNLHYYTDDNIDIEIYITNRVNTPAIILSSTPRMSQDDIISYILFGISASSAFDTSGEQSKSGLSSLALGAGLKELFNKSAIIKIDTLNILTNEDGTLGYEIGKRFSKNVRLVYKNDDISSITMQYSIKRSVRVDVDVKATGSGVGIFYIKDFKLGE